MKAKEDIKSISYLKANAASVIDQIGDTRRAMIITQNGEAKAVIQDVESYDRMKSAIALLKLISLGEKEVKEGKVISQEKLFEEIEEKLAKG